MTRRRGRRRDVSVLQRPDPRPWEWPGDSKLGQIQRIALAYRSIVEKLAPDVCESEDARWREYGHNWVAPSFAQPPDRDDWVTAADAAQYVSQFYPCSTRTIYDWASQGQIDYRTEEDGTNRYSWGSIMDYDQKRRLRRRGAA